MTQDAFDRRLEDWLDEGPTAAPADVMEAVQVEVPGVRRRARPVIALATWSSEPAVGRIAAAVAVAIAIGAGLMLLIPRAQVGGPAPSIVATTEPTATPPLVTMPPIAGWAPFISPSNGLRVELPADWTTTAATQSWLYGQATAEDAPWLDRAVSTDGRLEFFARATDLPDPMTIDAWVEAYEQDSGTCSTPEPWTRVPAAVGDWSVREICGRFVGLGVVDGTRGIVLSMRPGEQQPSLAQIDDDAELFAAIIESFDVLPLTD